MTGSDGAPALPDAAWWLEDPELWPLLAFEGGADEHGRPFDAAGEDLQQVLEDLIRQPEPVDIDFARYLLVHETPSQGHSWGFRHDIEIAAILVAEHRQVQDVRLLWDAIYRSSDTWGVVPHQLLYTAGVKRTWRYATDSATRKQHGGSRRLAPAARPRWKDLAGLREHPA
ncbi:hypothetical protein [Nonomuraea sp. bgisy101]|uniref:hypothetical protein n=1 Tax=Nonomuraea sp. bgisy101 TaxID=3413784 RepID=UPI003D714E0E